MTAGLAMITECVICKKTLGNDSRENGFIFCYEHRKCSICNTDLSARETKWCYDKYVEENSEPELEKIDFTKLEVYHARCYTLRHSQSLIQLTQVEFDYLNLTRLIIEPNMDKSQLENEKDADTASARFIANMTYEQQQMCLSRMQASVAQVALALRLNPTKKKAEADVREKEKFNRARTEALTSSRPNTKSSEDSEEVQLGVFMEAHGLSERKIALEYMRRRNKQVKALMVALKIDEKAAIGMADGIMIKGGFYNK